MSDHLWLNHTGPVCSLTVVRTHMLLNHTHPMCWPKIYHVWSMRGDSCAMIIQKRHGGLIKMISLVKYLYKIKMYKWIMLKWCPKPQWFVLVLLWTLFEMIICRQKQVNVVLEYFGTRKSSHILSTTLLYINKLFCCFWHHFFEFLLYSVSLFCTFLPLAICSRVFIHSKVSVIETKISLKASQYLDRKSKKNKKKK